VELGKAPAIPFNIFTNARYHHVKVVGDEGTIVGLGNIIKKSKVLSIKQECKMLVQSIC
jgi:hypothetical protein